MKQLLYLILVWIMISCKSKSEHNATTIYPLDAQYTCGEFYAKGKFKTGSYTFCGTRPHEVEYDYKVGKWSYWNPNNDKIADGIIRTEVRYVTDEVGCPFQYFESKIDRENGEFWNDNGQLITANDFLIQELESCNVISLR